MFGGALGSRFRSAPSAPDQDAGLRLSEVDEAGALLDVKLDLMDRGAECRVDVGAVARAEALAANSADSLLGRDPHPDVTGSVDRDVASSNSDATAQAASPVARQVEGQVA